MQIPPYLLRSKLIHEPFLGSTGTGLSYGAPVDLAGHWEGGRRKVVDGDGVETIATATLYIRPNATVGIQDHITKAGETYQVVQIIDNSQDGIFSPDHLEILLSPYRSGAEVR